MLLVMSMAEVDVLPEGFRSGDCAQSQADPSLFLWGDEHTLLAHSSRLTNKK